MAAVLALTVWGASPASAGGPTSVLLVSPESEETASLYAADDEYGELEKLLGPVGTGMRERPPESIPASSRLLNVTWLVHDVTPWRVDRVLFADAGDEDKDVWVHTSVDFSESPNGLWHRAEQPAELRGLLKELGVLGRTSDAGSVRSSGIYPAPWEKEEAGSGGSGATDAGPEQDVGAVRADGAGASAVDGAGWWWAIPGAVAGAVLALAVVMVLRPYATRWPLRGRRREPGPRQELLDG
ncbi:hypothetical protein OIE73_23995 [Streptomyces hirsutus]|uniref:Secreted protein n=1 Tax=Streptomyces hirsutus TaxID=35620 RepID=A0ABZ1GQM6_9ACTN|nr:hypothetical protein [Streptomyces hirsutus]WSD08487.1 hypothetical protein OIE73_23995 [Streptomyces hirsutus]